MRRRSSRPCLLHRSRRCSMDYFRSTICRMSLRRKFSLIRSSSISISSMHSSSSSRTIRVAKAASVSSWSLRPLPKIANWESFCADKLKEPFRCCRGRRRRMSRASCYSRGWGVYWRGRRWRSWGSRRWTSWGCRPRNQQWASLIRLRRRLRWLRRGSKSGKSFSRWITKSIRINWKGRPSSGISSTGTWSWTRWPMRGGSGLRSRSWSRDCLRHFPRCQTTSMGSMIKIKR